MIAALQISPQEATAIDNNFASRSAFGLDEQAMTSPAQDDLQLCGINPTLVSSCFAMSLAQRAHLGAFIGRVGATCDFQGNELFLDTLCEHLGLEQTNLDEYMVSSAEVTSSKGCSPEHL